MLPVIEAFMAAHQLADVTVVAEAGMVSEANQKAIETAGLSFISGMEAVAGELRSAIPPWWFADNDAAGTADALELRPCRLREERERSSPCQDAITEPPQPGQRDTRVASPAGHPHAGALARLVAGNRADVD
jgi:hypothetical protein